MSEAKFTKGEWVVNSDSGYSGYTVLRNDTGYGICQTVLREEQDLANAQLIVSAPKMYEMLESVASELYVLIDEVNDQRASRITPQTESEPDYHDMQTLHEIQCLLAEIRGDKP